MNNKDLSIATITWARDDSEEALLRTSLQQLATLQLPVYITDGGSNQGFLDFLKGFPNFVVSEAKAKGLWPQAKSSLLQAYQSGSAFILYTEPDKEDFFKTGLLRMLEQVEVDKQSGIITASRSSAGFASYPAFQQMTETTINNCCYEITGHRIDFTYGPFLLNSQLIPYMERVEHNMGWGWRPYAFGIATRLGYRIETFTGEFFCPPGQQEDNPKERLYRMRQLSESIEGIILSANISLDAVH